MRKLLMALLLLSGCATTAIPEACYEGNTLEKFQTDIRAAKPSVKFIDLTPAQRALFLKQYNSISPPTSVNYNRILYADIGAPVVMVLLVQDGCLWLGQPLPRDALFAVIGGGQGA